MIALEVSSNGTTLAVARVHPGALVSASCKHGRIAVTGLEDLPDGHVVRTWAEHRLEPGDCVIVRVVTDGGPTPCTREQVVLQPFGTTRHLIEVALGHLPAEDKRADVRRELEALAEDLVGNTRTTAIE